MGVHHQKDATAQSHTSQSASNKILSKKELIYKMVQISIQVTGIKFSRGSHQVEGIDPCNVKE